MFLSHLHLFLSCIAVVLFMSRLRQQSFSEYLLRLFALLSCMGSALWLYLNYYDPSLNLITDYFGIVNENLLLPLGVLFVYFLGRPLILRQKLLVFVALLGFSGFLFGVHWYLKADSAYIFYPTNTHIKANLLFQLAVDVVVFLLFLVVFVRKQSDDHQELFDGRFKKYTLIGFSFYYLQDIVLLVIMYLAAHGFIVSSFLVYTSIFFSLLTAVALIMIGIYTNWLQEFNAVRLLQQTPVAAAPKALDLASLKVYPRFSWLVVKNELYATHADLIDPIEQHPDLTKTEKLYAFLDHFDFSHKELADLLHVSLRTVETNFYRMRCKLRGEQ